jgi:hypothetical protein
VNREQESEIRNQTAYRPTKSRNYVEVKADGMKKYLLFSNNVGVRA